MEILVTMHVPSHPFPPSPWLLAPQIRNSRRICAIIQPFLQRVSLESLLKVPSALHHLCMFSLPIHPPHLVPQLLFPNQMVLKVLPSLPSQSYPSPAGMKLSFPLCFQTVYSPLQVVIMTKQKPTPIFLRK